LLALAARAGIDLSSLTGSGDGSKHKEEDPTIKCPKVEELKEINTGSIVRVKPGLTPKYGWGPATPGLIGSIHEIRNAELVLVSWGLGIRHHKFCDAIFPI